MCSPCCHIVPILGYWSVIHHESKCGTLSRKWISARQKEAGDQFSFEVDSARSDPNTSIRRRSQELENKKSSLKKILTDDLKLFPNKIKVVQEMKPTNYETQLTFGITFFGSKSLLKNYFDLSPKMIMTDEAHFNFSGFINKRSDKFWWTQHPLLAIRKPPHPEHVSLRWGFSRHLRHFFCWWLDRRNSRLHSAAAALLVLPTGSDESTVEN